MRFWGCHRRRRCALWWRERLRQRWLRLAKGSCVYPLVVSSPRLQQKSDRVARAERVWVFVWPCYALSGRATLTVYWRGGLHEFRDAGDGDGVAAVGGDFYGGFGIPRFGVCGHWFAKFHRLIPFDLLA